MKTKIKIRKPVSTRPPKVETPENVYSRKREKKAIEDFEEYLKEEEFWASMTEEDCEFE